ncbi:MAG: pantetheine-phosphate adenylyltransferase [Clostridia bacterium]|nr:pantetheine-phosphate adenylyltransferase [Clostridia bacterium]
MKSCLVTGSFDPFTLGHLDIVKRAAKLFDKVYIAILVNPLKKCMFSVEDRLLVAKASTQDMDNVRVVSYAGMASDLAKELDIKYLVRGIRNNADYVYEYEMAEYNYINGKVETICLFTDSKMDKVSSTEVRLKLECGEDIKKCVCKDVAAVIEELYSRRNK